MATLFTPKDGLVQPSVYAGRPSVFLAGSIDLGKARDWHAEVVSELTDVDCTVFSPRTDDVKFWRDVDLTVASPQLYQQVLWEQTYLEQCTVVYFYFQEGMLSPVSMLEFGQMLMLPKQKIACIDPKFYRRGNLCITASIHGLPSNNVIIHHNFYDSVKELKECLSS